ncbi:MAG: response regulator transcription factor [Sphingobacteriaceae bacterium]|nr:response regulator transcription factor [Sphingobacteriaceae bacterium]MBP7810581.1 response regulator transcription factor [Bacteroidia bacterium]
MKTQLPKRIIIVEDDHIIRNAFVTLIQQSGDYTVANAYSNAEAAIKNVKDDAPDICLMDIELPGMNGIEAIPKIKALSPNTQVVVVTVYENDDLVFKALCEGASGYLTKNMPPQKLIDSLKELENGGAPMSTNIARLVVSSFHKNRQSPLTARELEVLELLSSGKSYSTIADQLFVDKETVKSHIKNIYLKLEVHSKAEAIEKAKKSKYI